MKKTLQSIWPAILWTTAIFFLLSSDSQEIKESSEIIDFKGADKIVHFFLFLGFSFLWGSYTCNKITDTKKLYLLLILTGSVYGLAMEYYQQFFTLRQFSYWDAVADTLGTIAGSFFVKKSPYGNRGRNQN